jgi:hypothetical protein
MSRSIIFVSLISVYHKCWWFKAQIFYVHFWSVLSYFLSLFARYPKFILHKYCSSPVITWQRKETLRISYLITEHSVAVSLVWVLKTKYLLNCDYWTCNICTLNFEICVYLIVNTDTNYQQHCGFQIYQIWWNRELELSWGQKVIKVTLDLDDVYR